MVGRGPDLLVIVATFATQTQQFLSAPADFPKKSWSRHQIATVKLAGDRLRSLTMASRLARPIRCRVLPYALDQVWLARRDVEEHQRRSVGRSAVCLPRLDQFGADVQIAREHGLRRV